MRLCRLDSLVGLFAIGCEPTASADPFGLRRAAYALVRAELIDHFATLQRTQELSTSCGTLLCFRMHRSPARCLAAKRPRKHIALALSGRPCALCCSPVSGAQVDVTVDGGLELSLPEALSIAAAVQPVPVPEDALSQARCLCPPPHTCPRCAARCSSEPCTAVPMYPYSHVPLLSTLCCCIAHLGTMSWPTHLGAIRLHTMLRTVRHIVMPRWHHDAQVGLY